MLTSIQLRIARDVIVIFCVSLFVITMLVMSIGVGREAINQGLEPMGVLRLIPFSLPNALTLAVPGTALFSVCCVSWLSTSFTLLPSRYSRCPGLYP
jgi:lipopolysaccharide export system permease protein